MYNPYLKAEISAGIYTSHAGLASESTTEPLFYSVSSISLQFPAIPFKSFRPSPAKTFVSLTTSPGILSPPDIDSVFCDLKPLHPKQLIGKWNGFVLPTGHPFEKELGRFNWFGQTFDSTEDVAPIVISRNGRRLEYENWGRASLHEIKYQGAVSTALIYDDHPVIVYYRAVRPNILVGIMESKKFGRSGNFYFYLKRI
ncbi:hypothetical protein PEBR_28101 [Penicillium brasilianum]|uniref:GXWXG domain-containing protein n=1 Tax=Penicillium brasilianum TaxID=104259 RepID=A0A1S9RVC1_PENBI|nr:hypothetical protein PEBR_28101 [Penicillium brasilianum]